MSDWRRGQVVETNLFRVSVQNSPTTPAEHPPEILLYHTDDLDKFEHSALLLKDHEDRSAVAKVIKTFKERGQNRQLMTLCASYRVDLDKLNQKFPNFFEVIDYIRCCAEIAWRTDKVLRFTPILLVGDGGVGKTHFSESLANWMAQGFHRISVSSSQNGAELAGASSFFSNAKPGIPFTALLYSDYANPLIFLDEIDKNSTTQYDALGALYVLLEKFSAKTYKDLCYPVPIDASHILYIACANDAELINPALRTRFREFKIAITPDQSKTIAAAIVDSTLRSLEPAANAITFSASAMDTLSKMTPRRISQAVIEAVGKAFVDDVSIVHRISNDEPRKSPMGFLP